MAVRVSMPSRSRKLVSAYALVTAAASNGLVVVNGPSTPSTDVKVRWSSLFAWSYPAAISASRSTGTSHRIARGSSRSVGILSTVPAGITSVSLTPRSGAPVRTRIALITRDARACSRPPPGRVTA